MWYLSPLFRFQLPYGCSVPDCSDCSVCHDANATEQSLIYINPNCTDPASAGFFCYVDRDQLEVAIDSAQYIHRSRRCEITRMRR
jgi:hypothetical protein